MAKARKILDRVKAVRNIRTVTKTMELVSTARFRQIHRRATDLRPYTDRSTEMVADIIARCEDEELNHPLIRAPKDVPVVRMLALTSNRGLCGAYNASIVRTACDRAAQLEAAGQGVRIDVAGKKGAGFLRQHGRKAERVFEQFDTVPGFETVSEVSNELMEEYLDERCGAVEIVYMQFVSSSQQRPAIAQLLPLSYLEPSAAATRESSGRGYEFLPDRRRILRQLLPASVRVRVYQCFLDAAVSEQITRMQAMRSASENADKMIRELTTRYNRQRQAQITNELAEIMGGSESMQR